MKRFDEESYDDYKLREKQEKLRTKEKKKGRMIHQSVQADSSGRMFVVTYRKPQEENKS
jgi:hypothetical protein